MASETWGIGCLHTNRMVARSQVISPTMTAGYMTEEEKLFLVDQTLGCGCSCGV